MSAAGCLPQDLGFVDIKSNEMMFWMYLPISVPEDHTYHLPDNLKHLAELVTLVKEHDRSAFFLRYAYLTAKTLWVEGSYIGNRPGWHIDGYGTDDVNYIWSDRAPTEFIGDERPLWHLSDDCDESLKQMEDVGIRGPKYGIPIVTYPERHLLRLDNTVIHRSPVGFEAGMRTFVKVSLSHDRYNLKGNAINHALPETHWPLVDRAVERNHPSKDRS